jgi:hypothetical protein
LLVVRFGDGEQEDVWNAMDEVVEGELVPLSTLDGAELVDWKALDKVRQAFLPHVHLYPFGHRLLARTAGPGIPALTTDL